MVNRQWRITHYNHPANHIRSQGNNSKRLRTQPNFQNRFVSQNPQFQRLSSFREAKRYNSKDYEGKIRQRISNHQSAQCLQQKETFEGLTIRLPKIAMSELPIKLQNLSVKKDFVFNFYRKGKDFITRRKNLVQKTIT